jgi:hypothetical protein
VQERQVRFVFSTWRFSRSDIRFVKVRSSERETAFLTTTLEQSPVMSYTSAIAEEILASRKIAEAQTERQGSKFLRSGYVTGKLELILKLALMGFVVSHPLCKLRTKD